MKLVFLLFFITAAYGATEYLVYFGQEEPVQDEGYATQAVIVEGDEEGHEDRTAYIGLSSEHLGTRFTAKSESLDDDIQVHVVPRGQHMTLKADAHNLVLVSDAVLDLTTKHRIGFKVASNVLVSEDGAKLCFSDNKGLHLESREHRCQHYLTAHSGHIVKSSVVPTTHVDEEEQHRGHHESHVHKVSKVVEKASDILQDAPKILHETEDSFIYSIFSQILGIFGSKLSIFVLVLVVILYYVL